MDNEKCPCCPNHCEKSDLGCGRGRDYFDHSSNRENSGSVTDQVMMDLRQCGHSLHHNRELNSDNLFVNFSEEELNTLHELLSKIIKNIEE